MRAIFWRGLQPALRPTLERGLAFFLYVLSHLIRNSRKRQGYSYAIFI